MRARNAGSCGTFPRWRMKTKHKNLVKSRYRLSPLQSIAMMQLNGVKLKAYEHIHSVYQWCNTGAKSSEMAKIIRNTDIQNTLLSN